jgi:hypothetical protein
VTLKFLSIPAINSKNTPCSPTALVIVLNR